jgi:hypothetical protein
MAHDEDDVTLINYIPELNITKTEDHVWFYNRREMVKFMDNRHGIKAKSSIPLIG